MFYGVEAEAMCVLERLGVVCFKFYNVGIGLRSFQQRLILRSIPLLSMPNLHPTP